MAPHQVICIQGRAFLFTLQRLQTDCHSKWQHAAPRRTPTPTIPAFYPPLATHQATKSVTCRSRTFPVRSFRSRTCFSSHPPTHVSIDRVQPPFIYGLLPEHPECILSCPCARYYSAPSASELHPLCVSVMSADSAPSHVFCCVRGHIVCSPE